MKHTPAPWTWKTPEFGDDPELVAANGSPIIHLRWSNPEDCTLAVNAADSALIAAAPDLLVKLIDTEAMLRLLIDVLPHGVHRVEAINSANEARAAIAKAKGS